jgi:Protein of unknown function (DUF2806)
MPFDWPLVKTDLAPIGVALVEKLAAAVGVLGKPLGTVLQAHADAEATKIRAVGEVAAEAAAQRRRAIERVAFEEMRNQQNLEAVYGKTLAMLEPGIDPRNADRLDDDWLALHSERARLFSDEDIRTLFAKILAEEVEEPGYFPKRTIDILSSLEKNEAALFTAVCGFVVDDQTSPLPAIFMGQDAPAIYEGSGVTHDGLYALDSIGLVRYTSPFLTDSVRYYDTSSVEISYFGETRTFRALIHQREQRHYLHYGNVQFTEIGSRLLRIAGGERVPTFFDVLESKWLGMGFRREAGA